MKPGIHPKYQETTVTCSCGNTFTTRGTQPQVRIDLCNVCHPFYTGEQRIVDTAGQVERFTKRVAAAAATSGTKTKKQRRAEELAAIRAQQEAEAAAVREAAAREERARHRAEREKREAEETARAERQAAAEAARAEADAKKAKADAKKAEAATASEKKPEPEAAPETGAVVEEATEAKTE